MISFEELKNKWNNLPEPIKMDLLAYASALIEDSKEISPEKRQELEKIWEKYLEQENAISWGHIYNKLLEELI